mgnify:CR=1 FL=1|jgi:hypothetical protein
MKITKEQLALVIQEEVARASKKKKSIYRVVEDLATGEQSIIKRGMAEDKAVDEDVYEEGWDEGDEAQKRRNPFALTGKDLEDFEAKVAARNQDENDALMRARAKSPAAREISPIALEEQLNEFIKEEIVKELAMALTPRGKGGFEGMLEGSRADERASTADLYDLAAQIQAVANNTFNGGDRAVLVAAAKILHTESGGVSEGETKASADKGRSEAEDARRKRMGEPARGKDLITKAELKRMMRRNQGKK